MIKPVDSLNKKSTLRHIHALNYYKLLIWFKYPKGTIRSFGYTIQKYAK